MRKLVIAAAGLMVISILSAAADQPRQVSGVYPDLCTYSLREDIPAGKDLNECGIGAIVPWAGKLWMVNYAAHMPKGSTHSLYSIDDKLSLTIAPESVGGTPACRMIHKESHQLLIGPYLIDSEGKIRVIPPKEMPGRLTAIARHLTDPVNMVYYYDMEGMLYEVNVHTLKVNKLYNKPVPGWHGKGCYTSQGKIVVANNGESAAGDPNYKTVLAGGKPKNAEEAGVLAQWDGKTWEIVERRQFTDVTGPGGINGAPDSTSPLWAIGWDKRSLRLKLLDSGNWSTYLLPKAAHNNDPKHGWYTEWPRIREIGNDRMMMDMHGMFFNFPKTFSAANTAGISPISSHIRYIPDFCDWNGRLVLATDETSIQGNPHAGQPQCNLWFGQYDDLKTWGPSSGFGGPWVNDQVKANSPSSPFLVNGFDRRVLHLAVSNGAPVKVTMEIDRDGTGKWEEFKTIQVDDYTYAVLPSDFNAQWMRLKTDKDCGISAYFHLTANKFADSAKYSELFTGLAEVKGNKPSCQALVFAAARNRNLSVISGSDYYDFTKTTFEFKKADPDKALAKTLSIKSEFTVDDGSVVVTSGKVKVRLPKGSSAYDAPFAGDWPRAVRELESERNVANIHGTFYEMPRENPFMLMRPVSSHNRQITDFCTWNGLLVLAGVELDAKTSEHVYKSADGKAALWFGGIDDLWKFGKPVGKGGPWKDSTVTAGKPSDAYLMTGYDKKTVEITSDKDARITLEVDFDHQSGWHKYKTFEVKAGSTVKHEFEEGFSAHWVRAVADKDCKATVWFIYE